MGPPFSGRGKQKYTELTYNHHKDIEATLMGIERRKGVILTSKRLHVGGSYSSLVLKNGYNLMNRFCWGGAEVREDIPGRRKRKQLEINPREAADVTRHTGKN